MSRPLPWSFTGLEKFKNCPHAYHEIKVLRSVADPPGEAAIWGDTVHKKIEAYIKTDIWDAEILPFQAHVFRALMKIGGLSQGDGILILPEHQMALNSKIQPCAWEATDAWVRGIVDVLRIEGSEAWALDWKTGKVKPDSRQLKLFALLVFYHFPQVVRVHTSFEWLKFNTQTEETYELIDVPQLWRVFLEDLTQYKEAFAQDVWQKRQSGLCRAWCSVLSCEFNGRG